MCEGGRGGRERGEGRRDLSSGVVSLVCYGGLSWLWGRGVVVVRVVECLVQAVLGQRQVDGKGDGRLQRRGIQGCNITCTNNSTPYTIMSQ